MLLYFVLSCIIALLGAVTTQFQFQQFDGDDYFLISSVILLPEWSEHWQTHPPSLTTQREASSQAGGGALQNHITRVP